MSRRRNRSMNDIGKKMYNRRKELGLTLEEVGNAVGVGKSTVRRWENGMIKNMGRDKISALAKVLRMRSVEFVPSDQETVTYSYIEEPDDNSIRVLPGDEEYMLITRWRQADNTIRTAVKKLLDID